MISAGIVLYNPDTEFLKQSLKALLPQVDNVCLIDNASENKSEIYQVINSFNLDSIKLIVNNENAGIAYALNQILTYSNLIQADWLLTLDQDSLVQDLLIKKYKFFLSSHSDERIGLVNCYPLIGTPRNEQLLIEKENDVMLPTSGSFINVPLVFGKVSFDSKMFIDCVDYDFNLSIRSYGYKIYLAPFYGFHHQVGTVSPTLSFMGKKLITFQKYSSSRIYYQARNSVYMMRKWRNSYFVRHFLERMLMYFIFHPSCIKSYGKSAINGLVDSTKISINYSNQNKPQN
ncbi:putative Glycosyltransferase, group 2 family protein [Oenococcus oeni]|uniref:glycosyltransferase n=1 Tax=Oenococcus oeni TaxID=1247 RepID=UPI0010BA5ED6|nr:glycosyltransferase [Oenococcus oeni]SYW12242.1 putative Glycosyltransferase, group 2 family protein [Oenococcus oeni]